MPQPGVQVSEELVLHAALAGERLRAERYFRCIATIEQERNSWHAAYEKAVTGHSNAQNMMGLELHRLGRRLQGALDALAKTPPDVERARTLLTTQPAAAVLELPQRYRAEHDPTTGLGSQIAPAALDLTPAEAAHRSAGIPRP